MRPTTAFATLGLATGVLMAAASAPSPIYPLYSERWHFSVTVLTIVFAVYVVGLLASLLTVGALSDHVGRRPVLLATFTLAAVSTAIFWAADGPGTLIIARFAQGLASGGATSALAATLLDLAPGRPHTAASVTSVSTSLGMAAGAGSAGWLAGSSTTPDRIVFPALTFAFVAIVLTLLALPETVDHRVGGKIRLRPTVRIAAESRPTFLRTLPSTLASWAAGGLFLGLVPSIVRDVIHVQFPAAGGLSITALYLAVTMGGVWAGRRSPRKAVLLGSATMTFGAMTLALALAVSSAPVFALAALGIGFGSGLTITGNLRAMSAVTGPEDRSATLAAVYVVSYASLSIPTLIAGVLAPIATLRTTSLGFIGFVAILSGTALLSPLLRQQIHTATSFLRLAPSTSVRSIRR